ncbi:MAG TPA: hypothetical protein VFS09_12510 [Candidatus Eisenbacteria bacterium]|nr:hypothetical protein [Candidatus Eisenbacteria bacterium]
MSKPTTADAELLLHLYEIRRDPELRKARQWLLSEFKATTWDEIAAIYLDGSEADRWYRMATSYWEMVAAMVNRGVLNEELYFDSTGEHIVVWNKVKMIVPGAREKVRPTYLWNLEQMARRHLAWREQTASSPAAVAAMIEAGSRWGAKTGKRAKPEKSKKRGR